MANTLYGSGVVPEKAKEIRRLVIEGTYRAKSGHPGGSLSVADIMAYLYFCEMTTYAENPSDPDRDRFVLSKGHCAPALYGALALRGFIKEADILKLRHTDGPLQGHPTIKTPGVDMSTGSLGQGISTAVGMALAGKLDKKSYRVYTVLGDGECEEGLVWEAAMLAGNKKLDNLLAVVDYNNLQIDGTLADVNSPEPFDKKFEAFGWNVISIDGHDAAQIDKAFKEAKTVKGQPTVIIAKTIKGKGVSFMENKASWHGVAPNREQYETAMADLGATPLPAPEAKPAAVASDVKMIATRESYARALKDMGKTNKDLVVLDADLSGATKTCVFSKEFPDRFINAGIAEQNLMGTAAGLAASGKTVFASSFAMFAAGRPYEIIRNSIGYTGFPVNIGATHAGVSVGEDGASHQCNEDIALMRTIPGMVIINPADDVEAYAATIAAAKCQSPCYLRFGRFATPVFNNPDTYEFKLGQAITLREGTDVTIIATGLPVYQCLKAAEILEQHEISAKVMNIHTIKPLDRSSVIKAAIDTGFIVTVEEHSTIGGLGSAVCEAVAVAKPVPVVRLGVEDKFGHSGPAAELLDEFGLTAEKIAQSVLDAMGLKQ
jgi:Transketolase